MGVPLPPPVTRQRNRDHGGHLGTIVLAHGLMESAECLTQPAQDWAARGWTTLTPDQRGHGSAPRWTEAELDRHPGDVMTEDLLTLLDPVLARDEGPVVLYGHSAGGAAAAAAAADRAGQVAGVLLEDPFWRLPVTRHQDRAVAEAAHADLLQWQAMTHEQRVGLFLEPARMPWFADGGAAKRGGKLTEEAFCDLRVESELRR